MGPARTLLSFGFLRDSVPPWCKGLVFGLRLRRAAFKEITQCSFLRRNADYKWFMILRRGDPVMALHLFYGFCDGGGRAFFKEASMLWTIAVILVVLWALGVVTSYTMGGFNHILLVLAIIVILVRLIEGRRIA